MKRSFTFCVALLATLGLLNANTPFIEAEYDSINLLEVVLPKSPIKSQVLFIGGVDTVACVDDQGNPDGFAPAKQWHDFIGFTKDTVTGTDDLGWVTINHEMWIKDEKIGDGGGCTAFKIKRQGDTIAIVEQTLEDGRQGHFFNVDFVNTTGNTGANCGGIVSPVDGRIWTAEEWSLSSNAQMWGTGGFSDTNDYNVANTGIAAFDGQTLKKVENYNYMVEVDPRKAKAVRKQYNWGRQPYEGGCVLRDNKTVFTGSDATPGILTKFVADVAGDFTSGTTYVYSEHVQGNWIEMDNDEVAEMLNFTDSAAAKGATLFNRLEWVAYDKVNNMVYITETGRDDGRAGKTVADRMAGEIALGGKVASHLIQIHEDRFGGDGTTLGTEFMDYYGRVLKLDPVTNEVSVFLEGGPYFSDQDVPMANYPDKHLSNPDGLNTMYIHDKEYLLICEDLNGKTHGRIPSDFYYEKPVCELWLLDLSIANPQISDLNRIAIVPYGAEVTGAMAIDSKTILVDVQHPSTGNNYPYNNSLTMAFSGWDQVQLTDIPQVRYENTSGIGIFPNPAVREVYFTENVDIELYDMGGKLITKKNNTKYINVADLSAGTYLIKTDDDVQKLIVE